MILSVMAVLSLGLGLFLVINTVNAIVAQQVPQIGMMKAIGGTTRQMMVSVFEQRADLWTCWRC